MGEWFCGEVGFKKNLVLSKKTVLTIFNFFYPDPEGRKVKN
jgi:hypothetical protein